LDPGIEEEYGKCVVETNEEGMKYGNMSKKKGTKSSQIS
jgi:hypothetical protein